MQRVMVVFSHQSEGTNLPKEPSLSCAAHSRWAQSQLDPWPFYLSLSLSFIRLWISQNLRWFKVFAFLLLAQLLLLLLNKVNKIVSTV